MKRSFRRMREMLEKLGHANLEAKHGYSVGKRRYKHCQCLDCGTSFMYAEDRCSADNRDLYYFTMQSRIMPSDGVVWEKADNSTCGALTVRSVIT